MMLKRIIKTILPAGTWEKLKERKNNFVISQVCRLAPGFVFLDKWDKRKKYIVEQSEYFSQANQDHFLDNFIFDRKQNGFFLDIGGNDPIKINNTYFFEKYRNWNGLAFEPMPELNSKWKLSRKTECLQVALGDENSQVEFCQYENDYMSGFSDDVDYNGKIKKTYKVQVKKLSDVLAERKIFHVDFMSLDVEGAELKVLNGLDFSKFKIDYIVMENDKGIQKENVLRNFMWDKGYKLIARLWLDDVWTNL